jgi:O-acetyl-ADP-ribose deacetylase (regulator of RNase III)
MKTKIELVKGSVIDQDVDVIVNAANARLRGGGGIDGLIHRMAGPRLLNYLVEYHTDPLNPGEVAISPGFDLPQAIIHAPGPIWKDGENGEKEHLVTLYESILDCANCVGAKKIAFCSISTGIYGYPLDDACDLAISTIIRWLESNDHEIETIVFAMYGDTEHNVYENALKNKLNNI